MHEFNGRELKLLLNSVHERGMRLLDLSINMSRIGYKNSTGREPTMEDIRGVKAGSDEHFELVEKIRAVMKRE